MLPHKSVISKEYGVTYIDTGYGKRILDNTNITGDTLGLRRLKLNKGDLYSVKKPVDNISQAIKSKGKKFIDSKGTIFNYKKSIVVKLTYHAVKNVLNIENVGCVLSLKDIEYTFKLLCTDAYLTKYVGVLHTPHGYALYETTRELKKDTHRKI
jgi:hypothetical protein